MSTNFLFLKNLWSPRPHYYSGSVIKELTNGDELVVVLGGCNGGDFNTSVCPIPWKIIAHPNRGEISSVTCIAGGGVVTGVVVCGGVS